MKLFKLNNIKKLIIQYKFILFFSLIIFLIFFYLIFINNDINNNDMGRVNFYLGNLSKYDNIDINKYKPSPRDNLKVLGPGEFMKAGNTIGKTKLMKIKDIEDKTNDYNKSLIKLIQDNGYGNRRFYYCPGDINSDKDMLNILKDRINNNGVLIRSLNFNRHWGEYYNKPNDISFVDKTNKIVWRGTTTGSEDRKGNRFDLIKKWFNKNENVDVAFSDTCQGKDNYKKYVKDSKSIEELLKYKYILSIEGNDKDSGINWKMNSNSLVLMPKPTITSWMMETKLIPDKHYVLLKDDYSDLEEKYNWCNNNQQKCLEIIKNANTFMDQFKDKNNEEKIEKRVLEEYFKRLREYNI